MKKYIFIIGLLISKILCFTAIGQPKVQKIGYVNSLDLLAAMPEKKLADAELDRYSNDLMSSFNKVSSQYAKKFEEYKQGIEKKTVSQNDLKSREEELRQIEKSLSELQQTMDEKIERKRKNLYQPILDKVNNAIQEVAKELGYTFIFDLNGSNILYADETGNLLIVLKKKLGL